MFDKHGTFYCDNTLFSSTVCQTRAIMRHHHGFTTSSTRGSAKLLAGSAGHKAMEPWLRGEGVEAALQVFEAEYRPWSDEHLDFEDACAWQNCADVLQGWFDDHPRQRFPLIVEPENIEVGFQVPLVDECATCGYTEHLHPTAATLNKPSCSKYVPAFVFYGRLDAFGRRRDDGRLFALDHKFTTRVTDDYMDQYRMDSQMSGYVWGAQQSLGEEVAGVYINAVQMFTRLPYALERRCATHTVKTKECRLLHTNYQLQPYTRTPEQLADWHTTAVALARDFKQLCQTYPDLADVPKLRMEGTFHKECRWCEFKQWCEAGRNVDYAPSVLEYSPWAPFDPEAEA